MSIDELIEACAAENALQYEKANPKAVLGRLLGERPELKKDAKKVLAKVEAICKRIDKLSKKDKEKLAAKAGEKKRETKEGLPDMPNTEGMEGKVVLRFAPNPSGPLHIGHARTAILNDEYAKRYDGKLILRVEDTDPKRVDMEAYDIIESDLEWLGIDWDYKITQSKRLKVYKDIASRLISRGGAYVCECGQQKFKELKDKGKACPCRKNKPAKNLELWESMKAGNSKLALMLKTDIKHKNPALRDFPIMRVIKMEHPLTKIEQDVYPLMNFSVTVDDHLLGLTHVIRGKDHIINTERQMFIYDYLGWKPPTFIHNGLMRAQGVNLKTSLIKKGIEEGEYGGWDDARLGTLMALKRRGIRPEAIRNMMVNMGAGEVDVSFEWKNLYAENKKIIEPEANRYFFIPEPEEVWIRGVPKDLKKMKVPLHPDFPERGFRELNVKRSGKDVKIFISKRDAKALKKGEEIRLKNFCNIRITGTRPVEAEYVEGKNLKVDKKIQWLPEDVIGCEVVGPEGNTAGFCEKNCKGLEVNDIIQFERFGFVRVDDLGENDIICYFTHE